MNGLVTVIVPVYNVEDYLSECVESILSQTYSKLQIILVDDGSTDNSGAICDLFEKKDQRIKVFHKENGGQGSARNIALDFANGEYLFFVDSDDVISSETIEKMHELIQCYDADICVCNFYRFNEMPVRIIESVNEIKIYNRDEALFDICKDETLKSYVWNKLFRRRMFAEKRFPCNKVFEDAAILFEVVGNAQRVVYTPEKYYFYRKRPSSTIYQVTEKRYLNELEAYEKQLEFAMKECQRGIKWIECKIAEIIRDLLDCGYIEINNPLVRRMQLIYRKYLVFILKNNQYSKGMKISAIINSLSVDAYQIIRRRIADEKPYSFCGK